ncbi:MAG: 50S ribosomal protein L17 [Parachlamydiaceae bacterium]
MRHRKNAIKLNRTTAHRRCLIANMLKSLIEHGRIETTVAKGKVLKRYADQMVTLAKANSLASKRRAIAELMIRYNTLTTKEARAAKEGDTSGYNSDRKVINILFNEIGPRFQTRHGGYTRLIKMDRRQGDNAQNCIVEYLSA